MKNNIPNTLYKFLETDKDFGIFHNSENNWLKNHGLPIIEKFLFSTMDEVRLYYAELFSNSLLSNFDDGELMYYRNAVISREVTSNITYQKQRDHAAHTVNNYLFGWFIFSNSCLVKSEIKKHVKIRMGREDDEYFSIFANTWRYLSLLHDIGYLFEGSLDALTTKIQNKYIKEGAMIVNDFYNHQMWSYTELKSMEDRKTLLKMNEMELPNFCEHSISAVSDSLRIIGDVDRLREKLLSQLKKDKIFVPDIIQNENGIKFDAFDVWRDYYKAYNLNDMVDKINDLENAFVSLARDGIPGTGIRMLDHGVCSGLLLLLNLTFSNKIYFNLPLSKPYDPKELKLWKKIKENGWSKTDESLGYSAYYWWVGIVWATAGVALHNIQQSQTPWPGCKYNPKYKLRIDQDPLAYLGILVDIIQEWDRYTIFKKSVVTGVLPLQGHDVELDVDNEIIILKFRKDVRCENVIESLDTSLLDWDKIIRIE